jgi:hypothetical protein
MNANLGQNSLHLWSYELDIIIFLNFDSNYFHMVMYWAKVNMPIPWEVIRFICIKNKNSLTFLEMTWWRSLLLVLLQIFMKSGHIYLLSWVFTRMPGQYMYWNLQRWEESVASEFLYCVGWNECACVRRERSSETSRRVKNGGVANRYRASYILQNILCTVALSYLRVYIRVYFKMYISKYISKMSGVRSEWRSLRDDTAYDARCEKSDAQPVDRTAMLEFTILTPKLPYYHILQQVYQKNVPSRLL